MGSTVGEYQHQIEQKFACLSLPQQGITISWLFGLKTLRDLVDEATTTYQKEIPPMIAVMVMNLHGSSLFAWKMTNSLIEIYDTLKLIELRMRSSDNLQLPEPDQFLRLN